MVGSNKPFLTLDVPKKGFALASISQNLANYGPEASKVFDNFRIHPVRAEHILSVGEGAKCVYQ